MTSEELRLIVQLSMAATLNELNPSTASAARLLKAFSDAKCILTETYEMDAEDYEIIYGWGGQGA